MTTGKTRALTIWTFVGKVMSLIFNMLSRFVIFFFPKKHLLILWLQSLFSVIVQSKKMKSATVSTFSPLICHEVMGPDWRRKWQPTPVFMPGESQGRGSLVGCHLWGRTELDTTEAT